MKRVVITGMGAISPVGNSLPAFWDSLSTAASAASARSPSSIPRIIKVKVAAEVKDFDAADFGMDVPSPAPHATCLRSMPWLPPQQAVEDSGILGAVDPERLGVYVGSGIGGMNTFMTEAEQAAQPAGPDARFPACSSP